MLRVLRVLRILFFVGSNRPQTERDLTMKTSAACNAAVLSIVAAPVAVEASVLDWMLGDAAAPVVVHEAAKVAAIVAMVDLTGVAPVAIPKGYALIDGAEGYKCIKGKVSKATAAKLIAMGARRSMRSGGTWSVSAKVADEAFRIVCEDAAAAPVGCSVCGLHPSQFGKRCPGYKVA